MFVKKLTNIDVLNLVVNCSATMNEEIEHVVVSELMSDVLTMDHENLLLVTGLCTDQVIRTADIVGAVAIIITTGKNITEQMCALAKDAGIALFSTHIRNYEMCAILSQIHPCS